MKVYYALNTQHFLCSHDIDFLHTSHHATNLFRKFCFFFDGKKSFRYHYQNEIEADWLVLQFQRKKKEKQKHILYTKCFIFISIISIYCSDNTNMTIATLHNFHYTSYM